MAAVFSQTELAKAQADFPLLMLPKLALFDGLTGLSFLPPCSLALSNLRSFARHLDHRLRPNRVLSVVDVGRRPMAALS
jgi:hypothetical protein